MDLNLIKKLAEEGYPPGQISELTKIPRKRLYYIINDKSLEETIRRNGRLYSSSNLNRYNKKKHDKLISEYSEVVCDLLNQGYGYSEINLRIGLTYKHIDQISKVYNLHEKFKLNNQQYKSNVLKKIGVERRNRYCDDFIKIHKDEFIKDVNSGVLFGILCSKYKLPSGKCNLILNKLNLKQDVQNSFKLFTKQLQRKNSLKGADKVRGTKIIRHHITEEMEQTYQQFIKDDIFEGEARIKFRKIFRTCGKNTWNFLKEKFGQIKKHPHKFLSGKLNKMYGKEPNWKAGSGIKGHLLYNNELIFFRSSLELLVYLYLIDHNIQFKLSKHIVKYTYNGKQRNYFQDIVIGSTICEIKPEVKTSWQQNVLKFAALQNYCARFSLQCTYITESTYDLSYIDFNKIEKLIENHIIIMKEIEIIRLKKYLS